MSEIKQEPTDFEYLIEENVSLMIYPISARASEFLDDFHLERDGSAKMSIYIKDQLESVFGFILKPKRTN